MRLRFSRSGDVPLLDFVEVGEERDRDKDNDGLLAVADLDLEKSQSACRSVQATLEISRSLAPSYLTSRDNLQWPQRALHVWGVCFQVIEGARDLCLNLRRALS